jgi:hypothetical protein
MDPLKQGPPPLSTEWFETQKKKMKEAGVRDTPTSEKAHDVYTPSKAAQGLPSTKQEKFLENVKPGLLELDPDDEEYLPKATKKLVDGVIGQEYGEHFTRNPAYPQMQNKIARTILADPTHREAVEDFLSVFQMTQRGPDSAAG